MLQRFSEQYLADLSVDELVCFDQLLDLPDNELLDVVTGRVMFAVDFNATLLNDAVMRQLLVKLSKPITNSEDGK